MVPGRLLIDAPASGAWNMGVDEALLESVGDSGVACLRFYRWEEPTISLGYFQQAAKREKHESSAACPLVRRSTGGGAIVHDSELTYSLIVPIGDRWSSDHNRLYRQVHQALVEWLISHGATRVRLHPGTQESSEEPFLCFQRRADGDVELEGAKVVGSAQRRGKRALLQHGSILLERSPAAVELPGIRDFLASVSKDDQQLDEELREVLKRGIGGDWEPGELTAEERIRASSWVATRFLNTAWTCRR